MANITAPQKYKFKKYHRYDEARAKAGMPCTVIDELDQNQGTFTISLFDMTSKFVRVEVERIARENAEALKKCKDGEEREKLLFAQLFMHGWENIVDEDGKDIPFSAETALDKLLDDDYLFNRLETFAKDVRNFQADPRAKADDEAKN